MKNKIIKLLKISIVFIILFSITFSSIISQDVHHLEICHEDNCCLCEIIKMAINIIKVIVTINIVIIFMYLICYVLSKIHKNIKNCIYNTLVFQKVRFNE